MLKSCFSFSYKTITTRQPGQAQYFRALLEAKSSRRGNYHRRNSYKTNNSSLYRRSYHEDNMPKRKKGPKFYAVAVGRNPGIYSTWDECQMQVKGHSNARFKSFSTVEEAESFIASNSNSAVGKSKSLLEAETEINTYSKIAGSMKRPRVEKPQRKPADGSSTNPIHIEASPAAAAVSVRSKQRKSSTAVYATQDSGGDHPSESETPGRHPRKLWFHVMFDGGSRGNPHGHAGAGTHIVRRNFYSIDDTTKGKTKTEITRTTTNLRTYLGMGSLTNNQAEYTGLLRGLEEVMTALEKIDTAQHKDLQKVILHVQGDSDLIIKQMNDVYRCKSDKLKPYFKKAKDLVRSIQSCCKAMGTTCEMTLEHVYREDNKIADGLANEAMDAKRSWATSKGDAVKNDAKESSSQSDQNNNPSRAKPKDDGGAIEV